MIEHQKDLPTNQNFEFFYQDQPSEPSTKELRDWFTFKLFFSPLLYGVMPLLLCGFGVLFNIFSYQSLYQFLTDMTPLGHLFLLSYWVQTVYIEGKHVVQSFYKYKWSKKMYKPILGAIGGLGAIPIIQQFWLQKDYLLNLFI